MGQISQFLRNGDGGISHWCPGCLEMHFINTEKPNILGARWEWDGNIVRPTFSPSICMKRLAPKPKLPPITVCHYWLKNGILEFLGDCQHILRAHKLSLPPLPNFMKDQWF